jgi:hypothetical protein
LPYSTGVKLTTNLVPSLPIGSRSPVNGDRVNSGSESAVKLATKVENYLDRLVSLNATLVVWPIDEFKMIISSSLGGVDSRFRENFQSPPCCFLIMSSNCDLNGFRGLNHTENLSVSQGCYKVDLIIFKLKHFARACWKSRDLSWWINGKIELTKVKQIW